MLPCEWKAVLHYIITDALQYLFIELLYYTESDLKNGHPYSGRTLKRINDYLKYQNMELNEFDISLFWFVL